MKRTVRALWIATLSLTLTIVLVGTSLTARANFSYETAKTDGNDLSFYQPSITSEPYPLTSATRVRNVILCIGDGMGINQVALASTKAAGLGGKLHIERLPVTGLVRTYAANSAVTDSAAAGTALACGVKTNNGMIGMTPDERAYRSILELAQARGMATGLVVTCTMTHATPAVFGAHVKSRKLEPQIAEQLIANKVNVLFGGGRKDFLPKATAGSGRKDDVDVLTQAAEAGYTYVQTADELRQAGGSHVLGLFQLDALTTSAPEPSLAFMTRKAIRILKRANLNSPDNRFGFFLMIEGSQIDWDCHANNAAGSIRQTLLFDQAVKEAVDFAQRDGRTLVLVTADHETGGMTLIGNDNKNDAELAVRWSTKGHSGTPVGLLGPRAGGRTLRRGPGQHGNPTEDRATAGHPAVSAAGEMNGGKIILRVDATYPLEVTDGDVVQRGQKIQRVPDTDEPIRSPASGTIESIHFDAAHHELVIILAPAS